MALHMNKQKIEEIKNTAYSTFKDEFAGKKHFLHIFKKFTMLLLSGLFLMYLFFLLKIINGFLKIKKHGWSLKLHLSFNAIVNFQFKYTVFSHQFVRRCAIFCLAIFCRREQYTPYITQLKHTLCLFC